MATIGDKKVSLALQDGSSINLNKPIDIPTTVTDIMQITESGWYHGTFTFIKSDEISDDGEGHIEDAGKDESTVLNTPAMKIKDKLEYGKEYNFDVFVTKTGDYIFNLAGYLFYGVIKTIDEMTSINWEIVSPLVVDDLTSTSSNKALSANQGRILNNTKQNKPTISTTDLTAGTSSLATGKFYFVYD